MSAVAIVIRGVLPELFPAGDPWTYAPGFDREGGTPFWHYHNCETGVFVTVKELGRDGSAPVYEGMCTEEAIIELRDLGVDVARLHEVWDGTVITATSKEWLVSAGMREENGYPVPSHTLAGCSAVAAGRPPEAIAKKLPI